MYALKAKEVTQRLNTESTEADRKRAVAVVQEYRRRLDTQVERRRSVGDLLARELEAQQTALRAAMHETELADRILAQLSALPVAAAAAPPVSPSPAAYRPSLPVPLSPSPSSPHPPAQSALYSPTIPSLTPIPPSAIRPLLSSDGMDFAPSPPAAAHDEYDPEEVDDDDDDAGAAAAGGVGGSSLINHGSPTPPAPSPYGDELY